MGARFTPPQDVRVPTVEQDALAVASGRRQLARHCERPPARHRRILEQAPPCRAERGPTGCQLEPSPAKPTRAEPTFVQILTAPIRSIAPIATMAMIVNHRGFLNSEQTGCDLGMNVPRSVHLADTLRLPVVEEAPRYVPVLPTVTVEPMEAMDLIASTDLASCEPAPPVGLPLEGG